MPHPVPLQFTILREAGGLGDTVRMLPVIAGLKKKHPGCSVTLVCLEQYRRLFMRPGGTDRFVPVSISERRKRSTTPNPISHPYLRQVITPDTTLIDLYCPALDHEIATRGDVTMNRVEIFCRTAGVTPSTPYLPLHETERAWADGWLAGRGLDKHRVVALQIFSTSPSRNWPEVRWRELALFLMARGYQSVAIDHRSERIASIPGAKFSGYSIIQAAAVLSQVRLLIAPDSGLFHLAGAVGTPALGLFGPTRGDILARPYPRHSWIQNDTTTDHAPAVNCSAPCYGRRERGFDRTRCRRAGCALLNAIEVDRVGLAALAMLES